MQSSHARLTLDVQSLGIGGLESSARQRVVKYCAVSRTDVSVAIAAGLAGESSRLLSTASFLKEVGVAGGLRKEVQGFAERWIYGRGTPHIRAAFQWHRCKL